MEVGAAASIRGECTLLVLQGTIDVNGFRTYSDQAGFTDGISVSAFSTDCAVSVLGVDVASSRARAVTGGPIGEHVTSVSQKWGVHAAKVIVVKMSSSISPSRKCIVSHSGLSSLYCEPPFEILGIDKGFVLPGSWRDPISAYISNIPRTKKPRPSAPDREHAIAVTGPRGVGKSSLARHIVNRLLDHTPAVAFLETDLTNCEFTPSGLVTLSIVRAPLTGPSASHQTRLFANSLFVGTLTAQDNPEFYIECVFELIDKYR